MDWPAEVLKSWSRFRELCDSYSLVIPAFGATIMFRGQSDAEWPLRPTLLRMLPSGGSREDALLVEDQAFKAFMKDVQVHSTREPDVLLPEPGSSLLDWWAVMQHYGAPTRLLDWTLSPFVAAYFAVEREPDRAGAVYLFQTYQLTEANRADPAHEALRQSDFVWDGTATAEGFVTPYAPLKYAAPRMLAQQGHFTVCTDVLGDHGEVIAKRMPPQGERKAPHFYRLIIPADLKPEFRLHLRNMNVAASALFPGVEGLGRSITERVRLHIENP